MTKDWTQNDPHAASEAQKYDNPIPSREFILEFLKQWGAPISHERLCSELGLVEGSEQFEAVGFRLKAMCRDNQLMSDRRNRFCILDKLDLIAGRVIGHRDGFGFVKPDAGGSDLFISARQMRQVFDGDRVRVHEIGVDHRGRREGKIFEVIQHNTHKLVGRFQPSEGSRDGSGFLVAENQKIAQEILVLPNSELSYKEGQLVVAEIVTYPGKRQMAQARVIEVLGDHMAPGMEIEVAIHNYEIPNEWPQDVLNEISTLSPEVEESAKQNRIDLRSLPLCTIDGEDAKDFDDAVYAQARAGGGWKLWVAIADVSWYVRPGSPLDHEGHLRGNSVYFPGSVIPMLPEILSNGLCSLNPHVDRLAMVCEMEVSAKGKLSGYKFYEAVIQSHARLTYTKVGKMLTEADSEEGRALRQEYAAMVPHLEALHGLYFALRKSRSERGAMDFETVETRIEFGENRKIDQIVPVHRNDAHKLIEECMLIANVAAASFLSKLKKPTLYRVHEGPKEQKLTNLRAFLGELGLNLGGGDKPQPKDFLKLAAQIEGRPDRHLIQTMMLRSMQQAVYSPDNQGHFGLAYEQYAHFTSPIRRYPDLLVHRAIRSAIHGRSLLPKFLRKDTKLTERPDGFKPNPAFQSEYTMEQMLALGEHCSMTERRADDATRDVMSWLKCEYVQDHVGDVFTGVIAAVTGFGVFVELDDLYVEGLVHITGLPGDYYQFEAAKQRLVGERTRKVFKLGDRLQVRVAAVNLDDRKIDLELLDSLDGKSAKGKSKRDLLAEGKLGEDEGSKHGGKGRGRKSGKKPFDKDSGKEKRRRRPRSRKPKK